MGLRPSPAHAHSMAPHCPQILSLVVETCVTEPCPTHCPLPFLCPSGLSLLSLKLTSLLKLFSCHLPMPFLLPRLPPPSTFSHS